MSSPLTDRMNLVKSTLAARVPARVVTRSMQDFTARKRADLLAGVYTIISAGEFGYANYNGREAMDGKHRLLLVGQIELAETAEEEAIEDAEFAMADEVKALVRNLPVGLCSLVMTGFRQSQQLEAPYGWIAVDLEMTQ